MKVLNSQKSHSLLPKKTNNQFVAKEIKLFCEDINVSSNFNLGF